MTATLGLHFPAALTPGGAEVEESTGKALVTKDADDAALVTLTAGLDVADEGEDGGSVGAAVDDGNVEVAAALADEAAADVAADEDDAVTDGAPDDDAAVLAPAVLAPALLAPAVLALEALGRPVDDDDAGGAKPYTAARPLTSVAVSA